MRRSTLAIVAVAALLWPAVVAAAPAPVIGVEASYDNGTVHVTWHTPKRAADIVKYRIYYSHQSILENSGTYDDSVTTDDATTSYDLTTLPPYEKLYLTVVAVDASETESAAFGTEAEVDLPQADAASSSSVTDDSSAPDQQQNPPTDNQATNGDSASSVTDTAPAIVSPDAIDVRLNSKRSGKNTYTVYASFDVLPGATPVAFDVLQSIDGGKTYGSVQTIDGSARSITLNGVPAGLFGLLIRAHATDGTTTRGVFATLPLSGSASHPLTNSGAGLTAVLAASGAVMGWKKSKKAKRDQQTAL